MLVAHRGFSMYVSMFLLLTVSFANNVYGAEYHTYSVLNKEVQAVFSSYPEKLSTVHVPMNEDLNISHFRSVDKTVPVVYGLRVRNFEYDKEIGEYNSKIKEYQDVLFRLSFLDNGGEIKSFTSNFNRSKSTYTAEVYGSINSDGVQGWRGEKIIIYKKRVYHWSVTFLDQNKKSELYDKYKNYLVVLND